MVIIMDIYEKITDYRVIQNNRLVRDGFVFMSDAKKPHIFDIIVVRNPSNVDICSKNEISSRTLDEHIDLINEYKIERAVIIAEDINFIVRCPSLKDIYLSPADTASDNFDFSPLYKLPQIECLSCSTIYGDREQFKSKIDYSKIKGKGLVDLRISDEGHLNYNSIDTLEKLFISLDKKHKDLSDVSSSRKLKQLNLIQCSVRSLSGIEKFENLQTLDLSYNYSLNDINDLEKVSNSLKDLSIDRCPKIKDFSCLEKLVNLEHLYLWGGNTLPNLAFLNALKKLKIFTFSMVIEDGDLTPCMQLHYAYCAKNKKFYNLKDKDLPKGQLY